jgi:competence protein ComEC
VKNLTKSKIFFYFCLSFAGGVAIASFFDVPQIVGGIFLIGAIIVIVLFWPKFFRHPELVSASQTFEIPKQVRDDVEQRIRENQKFIVFGFCLIFAILGVWRYQSAVEPLSNDVSRYADNKTTIFLSGVVAAEPDVRADNVRLKIKIQKLTPIGADESIFVSGYTLVTTQKYPEYHYGDEMEIRGKISAPKNSADLSTSLGTSFDYGAYLAKDDIYSVMYYPQTKLLGKNKGNFVQSTLFKIKDAFKEKLSLILPEPQASLADGLILGEKTTLPDDLVNNFNTVGITHIIALSGFNITIIGESLRRLFDYFMLSRRYSFWLTVVMIISFVVMTGASPSIVRAAIMGILLILARKTGRLYSIRNALVFAGIVMLYFNPKILRFDLSFQLSFMATLGLVYISPLLEKYLEWLPKTLDLRGIAGATLGAQMAVLPLILFSFGRLSLIAPIANLLILPIIPLSMFWVFLSGSIGILSSWPFLAVPAVALAKAGGWVSWLFLTYQTKIAALLAKIPYAAVGVQINWIWLVVLYAILWITIAVVIKKSERTSFGHGRKP